MQDDATVFIIDDDKDVADALQWLVESIGYQAKPFTNPNTFLESYTPQTAHCFLVDVRMPDMSGLALQDALLERQIFSPLIFMTAYPDVNTAVSAMKKGAFDFLSKPLNHQTLLDTINRALQVDLQFQEKRNEKKSVLSRYSRLTPREKEVMSLMTEGLLTKLIAAQLNISVNTVELHRTKVMHKMEAKNLADLVRVSVRHALCEHPSAKTPFATA